jgi:GNAT superfamily N-acetyltransferase
MMAFPDSYYLDCIQSGILLYWHSLGKAQGIELHAGDIKYVLARPRGRPERIFNIHLAAERLEQRLDEIIAGIRAGTIPNSFLITPKTEPGNLPELLAAKNFSIDTSGLCMALDLADLQVPRRDPGPIQVVTVDQPGQLKQWVEIINVALCGSEVMSFEQFQDVYCLESTRFFLASYDGTPAAVSMALQEGETATLEFVATLEEYRNRGLGTAVTLAALQFLQEKNIRTVTLRGEPDGIGIYQKAGFKEYCKRVVASYDWGHA